MEDYDFSDIKPTIAAKPKKKKIVKHKSELDNVEGDGQQKKHNEKTRKKGEHGIWIGNLSYSTTRKALFEMFKDCGYVARVKLPVDAQKRNKGFAYVDFGDNESMQKALTLSEMELDGRKVLIKRADDFKVTGRPKKEVSEGSSAERKFKDKKSVDETSKKSKPSAGDDPSKAPIETSPTRKLFVGNLPFETTEEDVIKLFSKFGQVEKVRMSLFDDTKRCKGFAHVIFTQQQSAEKAMEKSKLRMGARVLRLEYGQKEERGDNPQIKRKGEAKLGLPSEKRTKIVFEEE